MPDVFISYGRKNRSLVEPLSMRLGELGVSTWMDNGIPTGERYRREIRNQLKDAKAVLVCWTPEALDSDWVDYEADLALEYETYVPVFLAQCLLQPPFSSFQTSDLSNWNGELTNSHWIMLVEKIAAKIGREGVVAAARAMASSDEKARYGFAKRYPDEPVAQKLWLTYEAGHREAFNQQIADARDRVRARINQEYVDLDGRLAAAVPALDAWLAKERCGTAQEPRPDASAVIERRDGSDDETKLRSEIASLSGRLAKIKGHEDQLNAELSRLSSELAEASEEAKRLREEGIPLRQELSLAKDEIARISQVLQSTARDEGKLRSQIEKAQADLKARTLELDAAKAAAAAASKAHQQELDAANALITRLTAEHVPSSKFPGTPGPVSASEKSKPAAKSRFWGIVWPLGLALSAILAIAFLVDINSNYYRDRENAGPVFISLLIILLFSIFAYRRARHGKATQ